MWCSPKKHSDEVRWRDWKKWTDIFGILDMSGWLLLYCYENCGDWYSDWNVVCSSVMFDLCLICSSGFAFCQPSTLRHVRPATCNQRHGGNTWRSTAAINLAHFPSGPPLRQVITQRELLPDTIDRLKVEIPSPALANACLQKVGSWDGSLRFLPFFPSETGQGLGPRDEDN